MRALPLILAAVVALLGADIAAAAPLQAPNQDGGSGSVPTPPNQSGGSGNVPTPAPTEPPARSPVAPAPSARSTPAATAAPAPATTPAPTPPVNSTQPKPKTPAKPKRRRAEGLAVSVARLRGCLPDLLRRDARVLVLRTGLGSSQPTSRARIAKALDLSASGVARAERTGLRRLRTLAGSRACEKNRDHAARVVRDAMAALRASEAGQTSSSTEDASSAPRKPPPSDPPPSAVAEGGLGGAAIAFAGLAALLGLALIARGMRKEARS